MHLFFSPERLAARGLGSKNPNLNACQLTKNKDQIKRIIEIVRKDIASQSKIYTLDELQKIVPNGYLDD